ncbi:MAG: ABC transporter permease [Actinomycetota bacterium]
MIASRWANRPRPSAIASTAAKDFAIARSYRMALFMDVFFGFINIVVYFFISRTFGDARTADLGGASTYFAFVTVGASITVVIQTAVGSVSGGVRDGQVTGTLEALAVQPVTAAEMALGFAAYPVLFALTRVVVYILMADLIFGLDLARPDWPGFVMTIAATGIALLSLGVLMGALVLLFKRGGSLGAVMAFAMGFSSGAFFPISVLPGWLRIVGEVMPTRFAFDGVRAALFAGDGWALDAVVLLVMGGLGLPVAVWAFKVALGRAEAEGTLGQY